MVKNLCLYLFLGIYNNDEAFFMSFDISRLLTNLLFITSFRCLITMLRFRKIF